MPILLADLRFGLKLLLKEKAFTLTAIITLGLAIGANTAIFSVVHSVLLNPLPFDEPERLVTVFNSYPNAGAPRVGNAVPDYYDRRDQVTAFEEMAVYNTRNRTVGDGTTPRRVRGHVRHSTVFPSAADRCPIRSILHRRGGRAGQREGRGAQPRHTPTTLRR